MASVRASRVINEDVRENNDQDDGHAELIALRSDMINTEGCDAKLLSLFC